MNSLPENTIGHRRHSNAMLSSDVVSQIEKSLAGRVSDPVPALTETTTFSELGVDSLSFLEIIVEIEQAFGVSLSPDEAMDLVTVGDLVGFLQQKQIQ